MKKEVSERVRKKLHLVTKMSMTVLLLAFCHYLLLKQYLISVKDGAARTTIIPLCNQRDDVSLAGMVRIHVSRVAPDWDF